MLEHKYMEVFVDGLTRYFKHLDEARETSSPSLQIGSPFLIDEASTRGLDYTGVISISGENKGHVFFSANSSLLKIILLAYGAKDLTTSKHRDVVGEVANTIAGNAREHLGNHFNISTPSVVEGPISPEKYKLSPRCFVLPFRWKSNQAELIVSV